MKILLKPKQMLGRVVKIAATQSGIILPGGGPQKKESIFFLIDECGPDVTDPLCKVGNIVCPAHVMNIITRSAEFRIITEESVFCGVGELTPDQIEIEGDKPKTNGGPIPDANSGQKESFRVRTP